MPGQGTRISAGELRHRIDIVRPSPSQDASGGWDVSLNKVFAKVWAKIETLDGTDSLVAGAEMAQVVHAITIRYIYAAPAWEPLFNYASGQLVKDSGGYLQRAVGSGTSGASAPTWDEIQGHNTFDGAASTGITWLNLGPAPIRTGVSADMQVIFQGRLFQIKAVSNPDERNKMLRLACVEINDSRQQNPREV